MITIIYECDYDYKCYHGGHDRDYCREYNCNMIMMMTIVIIIIYDNYNSQTLFTSLL